jgi:hypothetical protein
MMGLGVPAPNPLLCSPIHLKERRLWLTQGESDAPVLDV